LCGDAGVEVERLAPEGVGTVVAEVVCWVKRLLPVCSAEPVGTMADEAAELDWVMFDEVAAVAVELMAHEAEV
jgi:hypothetical protein